MAVTAACIPRLTTSLVVLLGGQRMNQLGPAICRTAHTRLVTLSCIPLNPEFTPGLAPGGGQAIVESIIDQQRHHGIAPVGHGREIDFPRVQQAGDMASIKITSRINRAALRVDKRVVISRVDLAPPAWRAHLPALPRHLTEPLRHAAQRVTALPPRRRCVSRAIQHLAQKGRHGDCPGCPFHSCTRG